MNSELGKKRKRNPLHSKQKGIFHKYRIIIVHRTLKLRKATRKHENRYNKKTSRTIYRGYPS